MDAGNVAGSLETVRVLKSKPELNSERVDDPTKLQKLQKLPACCRCLGRLEVGFAYLVLIGLEEGACH